MFLSLSGDGAGSVASPEDFCIELWRPGFKPPGAGPWYGAWTLLHVLGAFSNGDYWETSRLVPRGLTFDSAGEVWLLLQRDLQSNWLHRPGRIFWYIADEGNRASLRVAEKSGFEIRGLGRKEKRFGSRLLGSYKLDESP